jgi:hypothetical protein
MIRFRLASPATAAMALLLLAACAGGEPPNAELGAADAAIQGAQSSGAAERAPVELNTARTKYQSANAAVKDKDYDRASQLAREAQIDAQLAAAKAQAESARAAAQQIRQDTTTLQREITPAMPPGAQSPPASLAPQSRPVQ